MHNTLFIAHRGYSQFEKENTLVSFTAAGAIDSFYGIETDIHVTNDNHFITIHDENINRVMDDKVSLDVEHSSFEEVRKVRLPDLDNSTNRIDLVIPEYEEYLKICKKYHKVAVVELKQLFNKEQIKEIIDITKRCEMYDEVVFISFILDDLIILREEDNNLPAQLLVCEFKPNEHLPIMLKYNLDIDADYTSMTKEKIDIVHENNHKVNVWTVNDIEVAKKLSSYNIDYITSNYIHNI